MCGRFTRMYSWRELHALYQLSAWPEPELVPKYNVAPLQMTPVIRAIAAGGGGGLREGAMLKWGLVPSWADDPSIGNRLINARGETVVDKPAFRSAFAKRRCLVPVSGFYEWKVPQLPKAPKQPYWIGRKDRAPFTFAGLWEFWKKDDEVIESFTIITTAPNALMAGLHDRMPVIVDPADHAAWLDPANTDTSALTALIQPAEWQGFEAYPVSTRVNTPKHDDPSLVEPVDVQPQGLFGG